MSKMTVYYCDSSILVKHHISEVGSHWFRALVDNQNAALFTAQISIVEVCSALNRRLRENYITVNEYHGLMAQSAFLFDSKYEVLNLSDRIVRLACSILERHPLRGFDAVHIATAVTVKEQLDKRNEPAPTFLATDLRLLTAATGEGFSTFDPSTIP
jgi:predicted nucleic acid-binding protein